MNTDQANTEAPADDFVRGIDIHSLLPQQEPFVMVSRLEHFDLKRVATSLFVEKDNLFVDGDSLSASGLIENMAQTCAARIGYINKYILHKGIQIGFIGAIHNFDVKRLPSVGERVVTEVEIIEEVFGMILAGATASVGDVVVASTELKIAIKD